MILVIAEQKDGKLNRASLETIAAAQQLSGGSMPTGKLPILVCRPPWLTTIWWSVLSNTLRLVPRCSVIR